MEHPGWFTDRRSGGLRIPTRLDPISPIDPASNVVDALDYDPNHSTPDDRIRSLRFESCRAHHTTILSAKRPFRAADSCTGAVEPFPIVRHQRLSSRWRTMHDCTQEGKSDSVTVRGYGRYIRRRQTRASRNRSAGRRCLILCGAIVISAGRARSIMQLPENIHHQISGYRLGGFDKPVHQHLYDCPGVATVGCTVRGPVHHDAQELILAHAEPSMIAIVEGPRALLSYPEGFNVHVRHHPHYGSLRRSDSARYRRDRRDHGCCLQGSHRSHGAPTAREIGRL